MPLRLVVPSRKCHNTLDVSLDLAGIEHLDLQSDRVTEVFREEGPDYHFWLAVSPDEESVLYGRVHPATSERRLLESFR